MAVPFDLSALTATELNTLLADPLPSEVRQQFTSANFSAWLQRHLTLADAFANLSVASLNVLAGLPEGPLGAVQAEDLRAWLAFQPDQSVQSLNVATLNALAANSGNKVLLAWSADQFRMWASSHTFTPDNLSALGNAAMEQLAQAQVLHALSSAQWQLWLDNRHAPQTPNTVQSRAATLLTLGAATLNAVPPALLGDFGVAQLKDWLLAGSASQPHRLADLSPTLLAGFGPRALNWLAGQGNAIADQFASISAGQFQAWLRVAGAGGVGQLNLQTITALAKGWRSLGAQNALAALDADAVNALTTAQGLANLSVDIVAALTAAQAITPDQLMQWKELTSAQPSTMSAAMLNALYGIGTSTLTAVGLVAWAAGTNGSQMGDLSPQLLGKISNSTLDTIAAKTTYIAPALSPAENAAFAQGAVALFGVLDGARLGDWLGIPPSALSSTTAVAFANLSVAALNTIMEQVAALPTRPNLPLAAWANAHLNATTLLGGTNTPGALVLNALASLSPPVTLTAPQLLAWSSASSNIFGQTRANDVQDLSSQCISAIGLASLETLAASGTAAAFFRKLGKAQFAGWFGQAAGVSNVFAQASAKLVNALATSADPSGGPLANVSGADFATWSLAKGYAGFNALTAAALVALARAPGKPLAAVDNAATLNWGDSFLWHWKQANHGMANIPYQVLNGISDTEIRKISSADWKLWLANTNNNPALLCAAAQTQSNLYSNLTTVANRKPWGALLNSSGSCDPTLLEVYLYATPGRSISADVLAGINAVIATLTANDLNRLSAPTLRQFAASTMSAWLGKAANAAAIATLGSVTLSALSTSALRTITVAQWQCWLGNAVVPPDPVAARQRLAGLKPEAFAALSASTLNSLTSWPSGNAGVLGGLTAAQWRAWCAANAASFGQIGVNVLLALPDAAFADTSDNGWRGWLANSANSLTSGSLLNRFSASMLTHWAATPDLAGALASLAQAATVWSQWLNQSGHSKIQFDASVVNLLPAAVLAQWTAQDYVDWTNFSHSAGHRMSDLGAAPLQSLNAAVISAWTSSLTTAAPGSVNPLYQMGWPQWAAATHVDIAAVSVQAINAMEPSTAALDSASISTFNRWLAAHRADVPALAADVLVGLGADLFAGSPAEQLSLLSTWSQGNGNSLAQFGSNWIGIVGDNHPMMKPADPNALALLTQLSTAQWQSWLSTPRSDNSSRFVTASAALLRCIPAALLRAYGVSDWLAWRAQGGHSLADLDPTVINALAGDAKTLDALLASQNDSAMAELRTILTRSTGSQRNFVLLGASAVSSLTQGFTKAQWSALGLDANVLLGWMTQQGLPLGSLGDMCMSALSLQTLRALAALPSIAANRGDGRIAVSSFSASQWTAWLAGLDPAGLQSSDLNRIAPAALQALAPEVWSSWIGKNPGAPRWQLSSNVLAAMGSKVAGLILDDSWLRSWLSIKGHVFGDLPAAAINGLTSSARSLISVEMLSALPPAALAGLDTGFWVEWLNAVPTDWQIGHFSASLINAIAEHARGHQVANFPLARFAGAVQTWNPLDPGCADFSQLSAEFIAANWNWLISTFMGGVDYPNNPNAQGIGDEELFKPTSRHSLWRWVASHNTGLAELGLEWIRADTGFIALPTLITKLLHTALAGKLGSEQVLALDARIRNDNRFESAYTAQTLLTLASDARQALFSAWQQRLQNSPNAAPDFSTATLAAWPLALVQQLPDGLLQKYFTVQVWQQRAALSGSDAQLSLQSLGASVLNQFPPAALSLVPWSQWLQDPAHRLCDLNASVIGALLGGSVDSTTVATIVQHLSAADWDTLSRSGANGSADLGESAWASLDLSIINQLGAAAIVSATPAQWLQWMQTQSLRLTALDLQQFCELGERVLNDNTLVSYRDWERLLQRSGVAALPPALIAALDSSHLNTLYNISLGSSDLSGTLSTEQLQAWALTHADASGTLQSQGLLASLGTPLSNALGPLLAAYREACSALTTSNELTLASRLGRQIAAHPGFATPAQWLDSFNTFMRQVSAADRPAWGQLVLKDADAGGAGSSLLTVLQSLCSQFDSTSFAKILHLALGADAASASALALQLTASCDPSGGLATQMGSVLQTLAAGGPAMKLISAAYLLSDLPGTNSAAQNQALLDARLQKMANTLVLAMDRQQATDIQELTVTLARMFESSEFAPPSLDRHIDILTLTFLQRNLLSIPQKYQANLAARIARNLPDFSQALSRMLTGATEITNLAATATNGNVVEIWQKVAVLSDALGKLNTLLPKLNIGQRNVLEQIAQEFRESLRSSTYLERLTPGDLTGEAQKIQKEIWLQAINSVGSAPGTGEAARATLTRMENLLSNGNNDFASVAKILNGSYKYPATPARTYTLPDEVKKALAQQISIALNSKIQAIETDVKAVRLRYASAKSRAASMGDMRQAYVGALFWQEVIYESANLSTYAGKLWNATADMNSEQAHVRSAAWADFMSNLALIYTYGAIVAWPLGDMINAFLTASGTDGNPATATNRLAAMAKMLGKTIMPGGAAVWRVANEHVGPRVVRWARNSIGLASGRVEVRQMREILGLRSRVRPTPNGQGLNAGQMALQAAAEYFASERAAATASQQRALTGAGAAVKVFDKTFGLILTGIDLLWFISAVTDLNAFYTDLQYDQEVPGHTRLPPGIHSAMETKLWLAAIGQLAMTVGDIVELTAGETPGRTFSAASNLGGAATQRGGGWNYQITQIQDQYNRGIISADTKTLREAHVNARFALMSTWGLVVAGTEIFPEFSPAITLLTRITRVMAASPLGMVFENLLLGYDASDAQKNDALRNYFNANGLSVDEKFLEDRTSVLRYEGWSTWFQDYVNGFAHGVSPENLGAKTAYWDNLALHGDELRSGLGQRLAALTLPGIDQLPQSLLPSGSQNAISARMSALQGVIDTLFSNQIQSLSAGASFHGAVMMASKANFVLTDQASYTVSGIGRFNYAARQAQGNAAQSSLQFDRVVAWTDDASTDTTVDNSRGVNKKSTSGEPGSSVLYAKDFLNDQFLLITQDGTGSTNPAADLGNKDIITVNYSGMEDIDARNSDADPNNDFRVFDLAKGTRHVVDKYQRLEIQKWELQGDSDALTLRHYDTTMVELNADASPKDALGDGTDAMPDPLALANVTVRFITAAGTRREMNLDAMGLGVRYLGGAGDDIVYSGAGYANYSYGGGQVDARLEGDFNQLTVGQGADVLLNGSNSVINVDSDALAERVGAIASTGDFNRISFENAGRGLSFVNDSGTIDIGRTRENTSLRVSGFHEIVGTLGNDDFDISNLWLDSNVGETIYGVGGKDHYLLRDSTNVSFLLDADSVSDANQNTLEIDNSFGVFVNTSENTSNVMHLADARVIATLRGHNQIALNEAGTSTINANIDQGDTEIQFAASSGKVNVAMDAPCTVRLLNEDSSTAYELLDLHGFNASNLYAMRQGDALMLLSRTLINGAWSMLASVYLQGNLDQDTQINFSMKITQQDIDMGLFDPGSVGNSYSFGVAADAMLLALDSAATSSAAPTSWSFVSGGISQTAYRLDRLMSSLDDGAFCGQGPQLLGSTELSLTPISEDLPGAENAGQTLRDLLANRFTDADGNTLLGAVLVGTQATAAQGRWQSFGGSVWNDLPGDLSDSRSLFLGADTRVRFSPAANYNGWPPSLNLRMVDSSASFANGNRVDVNASMASSSAIGSSLLALHVNVTPVNDAPVANPTGVHFNEDSTYIFTLADFGFSDVDSGDSLQSVTINTLPASGQLFRYASATDHSVITLAAQSSISAADIASGLLRYVPPANYYGQGQRLGYQVSDSRLSSAGSSMLFDIAPVNDAPTASPGAMRFSLAGGDRWTYDFTQEFSDVENDPLQFAVQTTAQSTAIPPWLTIDPSTGLLTLAPPTGANAGSFSFGVTASDGHLSASKTLSITLIGQDTSGAGNANGGGGGSGAGGALGDLPLLPLVTIAGTGLVAGLSAIHLATSGLCGFTKATVDAAVVGISTPEELAPLLSTGTPGSTPKQTASTPLSAATPPINLIDGTDANDQLFGSSAADLLVGRPGNDTMRGGAGNDIYAVDATGDVVLEAANGGTDTIYSELTGSFALPDNVENLLMALSAYAPGALRQDLTGNALNNVLLGNNQNNLLQGLAGNDLLIGLKGADTLVGGLGNDSYLLGPDFGDAADRSTTITEAANEGDADAVFSARDYTLDANVENLYLLDPQTSADLFKPLTGESRTSIQPATFGTGNSQNNLIAGNAGANLLCGLDGNDTLWGGAGGDQLVGGAGNDYLLGGLGNDSLSGDDGLDTLVGGEGDDRLYGGAGADLLVGGAGTDDLTGGLGDDTLAGGAGNDYYYVFAGDGRDTIIDTSGSDSLLLMDSYSSGVTLSRQSADLLVTFNASAAQALTLRSWFAAAPGQARNSIASIRTLSGAGSWTIWDAAEMARRANRAPTLAIGASSSVTLAAVSEDPVSNPGQAVGALFQAAFADSPDASLSGVVICGNASTAAQGYWQYKNAADAAWTTLGSNVSDSASTFLRTDTLLRFAPAANFNGNPSALALRLVDDTGPYASGQSVNCAANGGNSAFSAATLSLSTAITAVNDAPTVVGSGDAILAGSMTNPSLFPQAMVSDLLASRFSDADGPTASQFKGVAVTANGQTNGWWQYKFNGPQYGWANIPDYLSDVNALFLGADMLLRFQPGPGNTGTSGKLSLRLVDNSANFTSGWQVNASAVGGANSVSAATLSVDAFLNDAPAIVGSGDAVLAAATASSGLVAQATVYDLVGSRFYDSSGPAASQFKGIVIVGNAQTSGWWQFRPNDAQHGWQDVPTNLSDGNAVFLSPDMLLRFNPAPNYSGTPGKLTLRLVDNTANFQSGAMVDARATGGANAISAATLLLSTTIAGPNIAPVAMGSTLQMIRDTPYVFTLGDFGFTDGNATDTLQSVYIAMPPSTGQLKLLANASDTNGTTVTMAQTVSAASISAGLLRYVPPAGATGNTQSLNYGVTDGALWSGTATLNFNVSALRDSLAASTTLPRVTANASNNFLARGGTAAEWLSGQDGYDLLIGGGGNDIFAGGRGDDSVMGTQFYAGIVAGRSQTVLFARGDGQDYVRNMDGDNDVLRFDRTGSPQSATGAITANQLWFSRSGNSGDIQVSILGSTDRINIQQEFNSGTDPTLSKLGFERFEAGGMAMDASNLDLLIQAMAAYSPQGMPGGASFDPTSMSAAFRTAYDQAWHRA